jgi:hypothetical protein
VKDQFDRHVKAHMYALQASMQQQAIQEQGDTQITLGGDSGGAPQPDAGSVSANGVAPAPAQAQ